jgi:hypothetical protein
VVEGIMDKILDKNQFVIASIDMETWREVDYCGKFVAKEEFINPETSKIFTLTEDNFFDIEKEIISGCIKHKIPKTAKTKTEEPSKAQLGNL